MVLGVPRFAVPTLLFQFPEMDAGGFFEVVAGVEDFGAIPEEDVVGDFAVADGVEEEESAFSGDTIRIGLFIAWSRHFGRTERER